jgi:hypothetical protein
MSHPEKEKIVDLYEQIFTKDLDISDKFLDDRGSEIRERLERAADEFQRDHANIFAINMCLHAASSVILSKPNTLNHTLENVIKQTPGLQGRDPTTVLTVSALYYLLQWAASGSTDDKFNAKLQKLRAGFDAINWLIGEDAMKVLGLTKVR